MSMNEYQCVVCFALPPTSIAVAGFAGFASMVCKLQLRFTTSGENTNSSSAYEMMNRC